MGAQAAGTVSYFPEIPPTAPEENYSAIADKARVEYNEHYAVYDRTAGEIAPLAVQWAERHALVMAGTVNPPLSAEQETAELHEKRDLYISYREVREDLKRISGVYEAAIQELEPPPLDVNTLKVFQRLRVKLSDLKEPYDLAFTTALNQLKTQRDLIAALYQKIVPALVSLRTALEPLGMHNLGYTWAGHQFLKGYEGSLTPIVKSLVREREKELALVPNPVE